LPAGKSARIFLLVLFFGGSRGQKAGKKMMVRAKSGQKKERIRNTGVGQRIYIHHSLLIYFAAIAPPLPSIKSRPTFATIGRHLRQHLPLSAAVHSTLPSVAVVRLFS
jgi:hypothetical protein